MKRIMISIIFLSMSVSCVKKTQEANGNVFYVQTQKVMRKDLKEEIVLAGNIKGKDEAVIYPRVGGKLIKNLVKEGDFVKKDETISLIKKDEVGVVYEPAPVPSTLDGYVGRVYQDVGADVNQMTPIALVVDQSAVRVQADVPEKYLSDLKIGQDIYFKVDAYKDKIFRSKINKISPVVDKMTRTFAIESMVDNKDNLLKSGMTAEVHIILKEAPRALSVPISALVEKNGKYYVYIADRVNNTAIEKEIKIGLKNTDCVEVKNLAEGSEIITVGLYGIKNDSKIKILND
ncbi:MAG: efflux RND transporter periplasmic adaptor subunit [Elusimicrobiales bacterium]|nr:efflux RND transporter periplasmic adaptor subunit [Elusimicrobiales bacterium]HOL63514.1 efflux RND transporter periplasmic adaptor subunit [Elusimicrobiales bacterium]HPO96259.1 efflux RND transporter periplasmic adaptor subunit [Elusimicrobiales bacterium]